MFITLYLFLLLTQELLVQVRSIFDLFSCVLLNKHYFEINFEKDNSIESGDL